MNKIKLYKSNDNSMIKRIRPNFYLEYFKNSNEISLFKYDLNIKYELWKTNIINKSSIFSISNSIYNDEIYICLNDEKTICIIKYNLNGEKFIFNIYHMKNYKNVRAHFNKCIDLSKNLLAAYDNKCVYIFERNKNTNEYLINKRISTKTKTMDLLLINSNYFVSAQPKSESIWFFDIRTLKIEKSINEIDSISSPNCLLLFKENIIVNFKRGLTIISSKLKEKIQYIQLTDYIHKHKVICGNKNSLFVCNYFSKINILEYKIEENCLTLKGKVNIDMSIINKKHLNIYIKENFICIRTKYNNFELINEKIKENPKSKDVDEQINEDLEISEEI